MAARYKYIKRKNHPLSTPSGRIPEHRVILYDKIGPGPHPCHHCGKPVDWMPGRHTARGALVADHLDDDSLNNDPANLVPSCHPCNSIVRSGRGIADEELFIVHADGKRSRAEVRHCEFCGREFLHRIADKRARSGRFCSPSHRAKNLHR